MNSVCMWPVTVDYRTVCVHTELVLISGNVWLCACIFFSETKLWTGLPEYGGVQFGRLLTGIALFLFNTFRRLSWMPKWMGHSELNFCFSFPWTSYYIQCEASQSVCILWGIHSDAESHVSIFWCLTLASKLYVVSRPNSFKAQLRTSALWCWWSHSDYDTPFQVLCYFPISFTGLWESWAGLCLLSLSSLRRPMLGLEEANVC